RQVRLLPYRWQQWSRSCCVLRSWLRHDSGMETLRTDFEDGRPRCGWVGSEEIYIAYHDEEWGTPLRDDRALFELLTLEGAQAGLSWITVLKRREGYRRAFEGFDI